MELKRKLRAIFELGAAGKKNEEGKQGKFQKGECKQANVVWMLSYLGIGADSQTITPSQEHEAEEDSYRQDRYAWPLLVT